MGGCCSMCEWMHIDMWMIMVHVRVSGVFIVACGCRVVCTWVHVFACVMVLYGLVVWVLIICVGVVSLCVHDGNHLI